MTGCGGKWVSEGTLVVRLGEVFIPCLSPSPSLPFSLSLFFSLSPVSCLCVRVSIHHYVQDRRKKKYHEKKKRKKKTIVHSWSMGVRLSCWVSLSSPPSPREATEENSGTSIVLSRLREMWLAEVSSSPESDSSE